MRKRLGHRAVTGRAAGLLMLAYWISAAGQTVWGRHPWGARLGGGLLFAVWILVAARLGRWATGHRAAGTWSGLVLATSLLPYVGASLLTTDILVATLDGAGVLAAAHALLGQRRRRRALLSMWALLGLAFLAKGPVALLPLAGLAWAWPQRSDARAGESWCSASGLVCFLLIGLGWFAAMAARDPALLHAYLVDETLARIASPVHRRNGPWWLPTAILVAGSLPWIFWIGPWLGPRDGPRRESRRERRPRLRSGLGRLLVGWIAAGLVLFTLSRSRLPLYVLPLGLPVAVLAGIVAERSYRRRGFARLAVLVCLVASLVLLPLIRIRGASSPHYQHSDALAREILASEPSPQVPLLFLEPRFPAGLGFVLRRPIETVALLPEEQAQPYSLSVKQLRERIRRHPRGLLAVAAADRLPRLAAEGLVCREALAEPKSRLVLCRLFPLSPPRHPTPILEGRSRGDRDSDSTGSTGDR
ncbi:MAG: glycosyltransferase family 39 protein [Acidobacteriota bacterium]|nr:MAG: glycosyltransferase family 39 protein [Acidobacteriota bacterium]